MTSSRFFAGASTSGADADAKDGAPTPRERAYLLLRDLVKDIRRERHERRLERTEEDGRTVDERTFHFFNSLISVAISMFELIDRLAPALLVPCAATRRNAAPIILLT